MVICNGCLFDVFFKMLDGTSMTNENIRNMPTVLFCDRERLNKATRYGPVFRNFFVVECNEVGCGSVIINGTTFPFGPRTCYILLPGDAVTHISDGDNPRGGIYCILDAPMLSQHFNTLGITSENPFLPEHVFPQVQYWLERMLRDFQTRDAGSLLRQTGNIYGLLGDLLKEKPAAAGEDAVSKAIGIIEENYSESITVERLAGMLGLDRSYFSSLFRERTGYTPHQYLTSLRIQKARLLLTGTDLSVGKVAELVGLDGRNFARLFQKETGLLPLAYKKTKQGT